MQSNHNLNLFFWPGLATFHLFSSALPLLAIIIGNESFKASFNFFMAFYLIMVALFVKENSSQLVSTTSFIFYLNMVTLFIKEVSSQIVSTTSVLSVLLGGIYHGQWLPVSKTSARINSFDNLRTHF